MTRTSLIRLAVLAGLVALPAGNVADAGGERPATAQKDKKKKDDKKKSSSKKKKDDKKKKDSGKKKNDGAKKGDKGKQGDKPQGDKGKQGDKPQGDKGKPGAQGQQGKPGQGQKAEPRKAPNPGPRVSASHQRAELGKKPQAAKRSWDPRAKPATPLHRTKDHRYARPRTRALVHHSRAKHAPPRFRPYRSYYARWWVHPFYRWQHATIRAVLFPFAVAAWVIDWTPDPRPGWAWVPGFHVGPVWHPGYWRPAHTRAVVRASVTYVYVAGYWSGDTYLEGYYRPEERTDGDWEWVEGYYLEDGTYVAGHWVPSGPPPEGMTWEAGFFDGEEWVEGSWRPAHRSGHRWISAYYDDEGVYHSGYWEPVQAQAGAVWVPGWFDGNEWQEGYWVPTAEYEAVDLSSWEPEPGYDAGWDDEGDIGVEEDPDYLPLAVPVTFLDEDFEEG